MKYVPKAPVLQSPLLTCPQRWNGRAPKLLPERLPESASQLDLSSNPLAHILASPSRVDRSNRQVRVPRALLLRMSLVTDNDSQLWLVPNVEQFHSSSSDTYIPNKSAHVHKRRWKQYAPLEIMNENSNITSHKDIKVNDANWNLVNTLYLELILKELPDASLQQEGRRVFLKNDVSEEKAFHFTHDHCTFNLGVVKITHPLLDKLREKIQAQAHYAISYNNFTLVRNIYSFILYNT